MRDRCTYTIQISGNTIMCSRDDGHYGTCKFNSNCNGCVDLTAALKASQEKVEGLEGELADCLAWIHTTQNHAPYEAAGATWQKRHDEDQRKVARLVGALHRAPKTGIEWGYCHTCYMIVTEFDEECGLHAHGENSIICDTCKQAIAGEEGKG